MKLAFERIDEVTIPHFKGGEGEVRARMFVDEHNRIMRGTLPPGGSIGLHTHDTSSEIVYVLSGEGLMICDGAEERLHPGECSYCPKGHSHTFINDTSEDVEIFAVVPQQ